MTLTDEGRRVAERPAFPVPPGVADTDGEGYALRPELGDPGMTIHEHATLELLKALLHRGGAVFEYAKDDTVDLVYYAANAPVLADAYCNALGAREAGA